VAITRHDETVAYMVSRERMEAIVESMEILADPEAMKAIRAYEQGKTKFSPLAVLDDED
jgi:antitoxin YefM